MKKLKKVAFSIMSVGGLIVPISLMASCGATTETDTSLSITPKTTVESLSTEDIAGNNLSSVITLSKVFDGITLENLDNITATLNDGTPNIGTTHTITLTAKDRFVFGDGAKTIQSEEFTTISPILNISKISPITAGIYQTEIDAQILLDTLKKAFNIPDSEFGNITATAENGTTQGTKKIILTANAGYVFEGGSNTLESVEFTTTTLDISLSVSSNIIIPEELANPNALELSTLQKLFVGIDRTNYPTLITATLSTFPEFGTNMITLTAAPGYNFTNGENTFDSTHFMPKTVLDISLLETPEPISSSEIANPNALELSTLQKLFSGIDGTNYPKIVRAMLKDNLDGTYSIDLICSSIYVFENSTTTLTSNPFTPI